MTFGEFIFDMIHRGLERFGKFYSSYRGYVVDNEDPEGLNRILVKVPSIAPDKTFNSWAYPKTFSGSNYGAQILPMVGDLVWVEFEQGKLDFPLWSHGHFTKGEKPEEFISSKVYGFKSPEGQVVVIDDRRNEVFIRLEKADGSIKEYTTEIIAFNGGENGGMVKVKELTKRLNKIELKINAILARYDTHVHIDPISGYTGPPSPPVGGSDLVTPRPIDIDITDQDYIEDVKILH